MIRCTPPPSPIRRQRIGYPQQSNRKLNVVPLKNDGHDFPTWSISFPIQSGYLDVSHDVKNIMKAWHYIFFGRMAIKGSHGFEPLSLGSDKILDAKRAKASRGFEPRSLDSESRVLTVTPRGHLILIQAYIPNVCLIHRRHLRDMTYSTLCAIRLSFLWHSHGELRHITHLMFMV